MPGRYNNELLNFIENNLPALAGLLIILLLFGAPILAGVLGSR